MGALVVGGGGERRAEWRRRKLRVEEKVREYLTEERNRGMRMYDGIKGIDDDDG